MRGSRFRRSAAKKSSKEKREDHGNQFVYQEEAVVDPTQVSEKALNAVLHLGNQRFALPPFSEHFQRWMKDLTTVLTEFETQLPEARDPQYRDEIDSVLTRVQENFSQRALKEQNLSEGISKLQNSLNQRETEITRLQNEQKARGRETRRRFENSQEKLRSEIDSLDRKRLKMLRKRSSFIHRILHRSESGIEENTKTLEAKKKALRTNMDAFGHELEKSKIENEHDFERLNAEVRTLQEELSVVKGNTVDDALEVRQLACQELHRTIEQAKSRFDQRKQTDSTAL